MNFKQRHNPMQPKWTPQQRKEKTKCWCVPRCGWTEVNNVRAKWLRHWGYSIKNGLDNKLPGQWVPACAITRARVEQELAKAAPEVTAEELLG